MSYETFSKVPVEFPLKRVAELAVLLGYTPLIDIRRQLRHNLCYFTHFEKRDYKSWAEIFLTIKKHDDCIEIHTKSSAGRSHYDFIFQNRTVDEFQKWFGGTYRTDGRRHPFYKPYPQMPPPASGCYLAINRLDWNLNRLNIYLMKNRLPPPQKEIGPYPAMWLMMAELEPSIFGANVLVPYLLSAIEDYFKSTYVSILRYSASKENILKGARLSGEQLSLISSSKLSIEEAVASNMSFQNLQAINKTFRDLDPHFDIGGALRKPFRRRKMSFYEQLESLINMRHNLIHRSIIDTDFDIAKLEKLLRDVSIALSRVYHHITTKKQWPYRLPISINFDEKHLK